MNSFPSRRWIAHSFGAALLAASFAAQAGVGARVMLQTWSPTTPKQQGLQVLVNDASVVSDQLQKAWTQARPRLCAQLVRAMGKGKAAAGQTLRDITCLLDEHPAFSVSSAGPNALSAMVAIGGYVEATSTTPTALGSYADPRFSLALKGHLGLTLTLQPNPDQTLRIDKAAFSLSNATIDSHNFVGDVLKFIVDDLLPFFSGVNFKQLAEGAINGASIDIAGIFNSELAPINARLRGPSGAVRVAVWGKPDAIIVAFGPRELTPPSGGTMFGALRWDAGKVLAPGSCDSFSITATVQTGPAPLRDPNGYYEAADAPTRKVGNFQLQPNVSAGECRYRMTGLAAAWPNEVLARSSIGAKKVTGNSLYKVSYALASDGWDGHTVVPQPSAERNYVVRGSANATAAVDPAVVAKRELLNPGGPVAAKPAAIDAKTKLGTVSPLQQKANAVSLNPQPLPPASPTVLPTQVPSALR
jgi:hypothetical protein